MGRISSEEKPKENQEKTKRKSKRIRPPRPAAQRPQDKKRAVFRRRRSVSTNGAHFCGDGGRGDSPFLCHPQRRRVRRFLRITPLGRLGGPKPSKYNPNPATCAAGSEALRSKVSLHVSPAAPQAQGKRVLAKKAGNAGLFRQAEEGATAPSCAIRSGGVYAAKERLQAAFPEKPHWGGLEGRSPPNGIRTRRHARRVRKPCAARFPCTFPRPRPRRRGNVSWRKRPATPAFFDKLRKGRQPLPVPSAAAACTPPRSGCRLPPAAFLSVSLCARRAQSAYGAVRVAVYVTPLLQTTYRLAVSPSASASSSFIGSVSAPSFVTATR